ncbi:YdgA family protein [Sansalvadorimonas sp. 2012CJ34-2]|uniref:YdgA family protein n=1 Tax=Parendozoicomonas callyspongiae TaxID=2942213 RepID=A0ABT0PF92_9GAMM|nr:DUF945 family protein [Sansalvadorimonas sp. 2012CJ34-2]MCL6270030.1 YdgA family protein [Sansalvadorimonas sp. 2012CJ34-2]
MGSKAKLGLIACVILGGGVIALPGISGIVANNFVENDLKAMAESSSYSIAEMSLDRGFSSTQVSVVLQGEGLRELNQESIEITGELSHSGIAGFPEMVSGQFDVTVIQGRGKDRLELAGDIESSLSWLGREQVAVDMSPVIFPVDPESGSLVAIDEYRVSYDSDNNQPDAYSLQLTDINLRVAEAGYEVATIDIAPSALKYSPASREWLLEAPELEMGVPNEATRVTVENVTVGGSEKTVGGVASSEGFFETGKMYLSPEGESLLESVKAKASLENIRVSALGELLKAIDGADAAGQKSTQTAVIELLQDLPRYSLDELMVDTGHGSITMNFDVAATKNTAKVVQSLIDNPPQNEVQEYLAAQNVLNNVRSSARVKVTEELIGWGCDMVSAMQTQDPVQLPMMAGACKGLVDGGHFLNMACVQSGWECAEKMKKVQAVWEKDRSLELILDEGRMTLNNVEFDAQGMF